MASENLSNRLSGLQLSTKTQPHNNVADSWSQDTSPTGPDDSPPTTSSPSPSSSQTPTTAALSPSETKSVPRAPPSTPATASPHVPTTDWSASSGKFRSLESALEEGDEEGGSPSRTIRSSAHEGSGSGSTTTTTTRVRVAAEERDRARGWNAFAGGGGGGGDPREVVVVGGGSGRERIKGGEEVGEGKRPEKSTAVASRLIAAGLGVKAPRRTEEQREYDRAIRAQEKRRREKEVEEERKRKEAAERAKAAIWDD